MALPDYEIWLHGNRRVLLAALVLPALLLAAGGALWGLTGSVWLRGTGGLLVLVGVVAGLVIAWQWRLPRLARAGGELWVYVGRTQPERVPLEMIECFFLGRGPAGIPLKAGEETETANVVVRLAERASQYAQREISPTLGRWCGGYITLRGAWCEQLNLQRVNQLNRRLHAAQQAAATVGELAT